MKHIEVKQLKEDAMLLIQHIVDVKAINFHVNYGMDRNLKKLTTAVNEIDSHINPRLRELEQKAYDLGEKNFEKGLPLLSQEEQDERADLYSKYLEDMQGENDFEIFYIDIERCENLEIEFPYMQLLTKFIRPE